MKITILLILFSLSAYCPVSNFLVIPEAPKINPYEKIWKAHCIVESSNNPYAVGDTKLKNFSYGIVQIRKSRLDDYYEKTGIRYFEKDMIDTVKAKEVFMYYALQYSPDDIERISREWNVGTKGMQKKSTIKYYRKILNAVEK